MEGKSLRIRGIYIGSNDHPYCHALKEIVKRLKVYESGYGETVWRRARVDEAMIQISPQAYREAVEEISLG